MWVARQMGHSSWVITARVYARWMPSAADDAGGKAEALFATEKPVKMLAIQGLM